MSVFYPARGTSKGKREIKRDGHTITWDAFWASDSPWLVNGAARMRFTLALPD